MAVKSAGAPLEIEVLEVARHRNGGEEGEPFHVVTFDLEDGRPMIAIVFDEPGHVAVLDRVKAGLGEIAYGANSWRGEVYEEALRRAIRRRR